MLQNNLSHQANHCETFLNDLCFLASLKEFFTRLEQYKSCNEFLLFSPLNIKQLFLSILQAELVLMWRVSSKHAFRWASSWHNLCATFSQNIQLAALHSYAHSIASYIVFCYNPIENAKCNAPIDGLSAMCNNDARFALQKATNILTIIF